MTNPNPSPIGIGFGFVQFGGVFITDLNRKRVFVNPLRTLQLDYNAIFDTGCIGLQSCIEMQPKKCMQPTDKLKFIFFSTLPLLDK